MNVIELTKSSRKVSEYKYRNIKSHTKSESSTEDQNPTDIVFSSTLLSHTEISLNKNKLSVKRQ